MALHEPARRYLNELREKIGQIRANPHPIAALGGKDGLVKAASSAAIASARPVATVRVSKAPDVSMTESSLAGSQQVFLKTGYRPVTP